MKIIADSSTLLTKEQAEKLNVSLAYLSIESLGTCYKEFEELSSQELLEQIKRGSIPKSSQPSIGEVLDLYESSDRPVLNISMAQGLSGTYDSACMAKEQAENSDLITVFNSRTLCGPHLGMVEYAAAECAKGKPVDEIVQGLETMQANEVSYLIPADFNYLVRGGRLSRTAGFAGQLLGLIPILKKAQDGTCLEKLSTVRTWKKAVTQVLDDMEANGKILEKTVFYVSDAENPSRKQVAVKMIQERFPDNEVRQLDLSPAFITQGGPGCVAIQAVAKPE